MIDRLKDELALRSVRGIVTDRRVQACLDYGAGNGRFAYALVRALPDARVVAVDFTDLPPDSKRSYFGRGMEYMSYRSLEASSSHFDLIFCRHVLEHTHDPRSFVASLVRRLAPAGLLDIEVPNFDSALAKLAGRYNPGYYVPRHLLHFTHKSLRMAAGFGTEVRLSPASMPLMGNLLADISGHRRSELPFQLAGVPLYALQVAADTLLQTSTCLSMQITKPGLPA